MKTKCNKCDERGYIVDKTCTTGYSAHSCECGWAIEQQEERFKGFSLADLVNHLEARRISRGRLMPHEIAERNL